MNVIRRTLLLLLTSLSILSTPGGAAHATVLTTPGISIVVLPVQNNTPIEVWESKYYPVDVFPEKITEEFVTLLREYPYAQVLVLPPEQESEWFRGRGPKGDLGIKLLFYKLKMTDRKHLGMDRMGYVALRIELFDGITRERFGAFSVAGEDRRFTFMPGDGRTFYLTKQPESGKLLFFRPLDLLPINKMFPRGLDFWQLFPNPKEYDQPMSRPLWKSFKRTSYWNAFKKALRKSRDTLFDGITGYRIIGRIISPTKDNIATKPPKRRRYIMSLGKIEGLRPGDLLSVIRSDRYDTVDPERPVVVLPDKIGTVKVLWVQEHEAIIEVVKENKEAPIGLRDLVVMSIYHAHR